MGVRLRDKTERLKATAEQARALAAFENPIIKQWFREEEGRIVAALFNARSDDERRELAARGKALRDLAGHIYGALADGERADRQLSERH